MIPMRIPMKAYKGQHLVKVEGDQQPTVLAIATMNKLPPLNIE